MTFQICKQPHTPNFETLPVAKITDYPLEPRDYRPFAQAHICLTPESLIVQMWSFEVSPSPQSSLRAVLQFVPGSPALSMEVDSQNKLTFGTLAEGTFTSLQSLGIQEPAVELFAGEDLQGIYWGAGFTVMLRSIGTLCGKDAFEPGDIIRGNFYKLSSNRQKSHKGSFFPADFAGGKAFEGDSLGVLEVVGY